MSDNLRAALRPPLERLHGGHTQRITTMGSGIGGAFSKIMDFAKPVLGAVTGGLGGGGGGGGNPLSGILGKVGDLIPGGAGGILKNIMGLFGGGAGGAMEGAGGNNLLSGLLGMITGGGGGKGGITDLLGSLFKGGGMSDQGQANVVEQAAKSMGSIFGGLFGGK
jgi:hypothetical protein